jgi:hypothetical protein
MVKTWFIWIFLLKNPPTKPTGRPADAIRGAEGGAKEGQVEGDPGLGGWRHFGADGVISW